MGTSEKELNNQVISVLNEKDLTYKNQVFVGNFLSDFYIQSNSGAAAVFEVKPWEATEENLKRATNLANSIMNTSGSPNSFVVLPGSFKTPENSNVVSINEFPNFVSNILNQNLEETFADKLTVEEPPEKYIFVAMPFSPKFDDAFNYGIQTAAKECGFKAIRSDKEYYSDSAVKKIKEWIKGSEGIVADISGANANVFYEVGYAEASDKKRIQICSTKINKVPFVEWYSKV